MISMRTLLAIILCGVTMACGAGGSSPSDNSNSAGGQDGSGGNPDSPTGGGGGDGVQCDPKSDGTCQPITGNGGDDGNGGSSGAGGAAGGCADDERILDSQDNLVCPGTGGMGGQPDAGGSNGGAGGSEPQEEACPALEDMWTMSAEDMPKTNPCWTQGDWISVHSPGSIYTIKVTKISDTPDYRANISGEFIDIHGDFTGPSLPLERSGEDPQLGSVRLVMDLNDQDHLTFKHYDNGEPSGSDEAIRH